jgi:catechol 2,3-dioxygenase-like lactoylglutathione lyase family enzyme
MKLNLLVLRCQDIEKSKAFYEKLSFSFEREKHGKGDEHYASVFDEMVFELYPLKSPYLIDNTRLGFSLEVQDIKAYLKRQEIDIVLEYSYEGVDICVVCDPDNRKVELKCKI